MSAPSSPSAIILFAHGARDVRWKEPFIRLAEILQASAPKQIIRLAFLELMEPRLPEVIEELVEIGIETATVIPVFFGQGGHIRRDLPALIEACQTQFPTIKIHASPAVGEDEAVLQAIAQYCLKQAQ